MKPGAQVIFIKNDKERRWVNGTLGTVIAIGEEEGIISEMTVATKQRLEALEPYKFAEKYVTEKPQGYKEIIEAIRPQ